jgi:hypothetical protein
MPSPPLDSLTDATREARIRELGEAMVRADSEYARNVLWQQMRALIAGRSRAQVTRMEKQKGLR